ncbi:MAG: hypothetical protein ACLRXQ_05255 [Phascolarctobacterium faecium]
MAVPAIVKLPAFRFVTASGAGSALLFIGSLRLFQDSILWCFALKQLKRNDAVPVGYGAICWKVLLALLRGYGLMSGEMPRRSDVCMATAGQFACCWYFSRVGTALGFGGTRLA